MIASVIVLLHLSSLQAVLKAKKNTRRACVFVALRFTDLVQKYSFYLSST